MTAGRACSEPINITKKGEPTLFSFMSLEALNLTIYVYICSLFDARFAKFEVRWHYNDC